MMKGKAISAQDIVKRFNIPYHTVNYYTTIGLLPLLRKEGNQRMYDAQVIRRRLNRIFTLSKKGYPLNLIRKKIIGV
ncbi:MAG: MerR family transcriptional regulator [Candidatus Omnitrophota bacterium]|nr:MAG: MerR family transcriptional regulator [Candidatus Omnitrophota bacterium]